jgi:hypothetical protein
MEQDGTRVIARFSANIQGAYLQHFATRIGVTSGSGPASQRAA